MTFCSNNDGVPYLEIAVLPNTLIRQATHSRLGLINAFGLAFSAPNLFSQPCGSLPQDDAVLLAGIQSKVCPLSIEPNLRMQCNTATKTIRRDVTMLQILPSPVKNKPPKKAL